MVSIIIPTRDRLELLRACLDSVQTQTFADWECLVVDDHSNDGTPEVVHRLCQRDARFKYLELTNTVSGANAARNLGLEKSSGDLVFFLDSDDALHPQCLQARVDAMQAHPRIDFGVFPTLLLQRKLGTSDLLWNIATNENDLDRFLFLDIPWQTGGALWRVDSLRKLGPWTEGLPSWQDWEFHTRALCRGFQYLRFQEGYSYWRTPRPDSLWSQSLTESHVRAQVGIIDNLVRQLHAQGSMTGHRKDLLAGLYFWQARNIYRKHRRRFAAAAIWAKAWKKNLISMMTFAEGLRWFSRATRGPYDDVENVFPHWPIEFQTGSSTTLHKVPLSGREHSPVRRRIGIFIDEWRDGGVPVFVERLERSLTCDGFEVFIFLAHAHPKRDEISKNLYLKLKSRLGRRCVTLNYKSHPLAWRKNHLRNVILSREISCLLINHFSFYVEDLAAISNEVPLISTAHTDLDYYYSEYLQTMDFTRAHIVVSERIREKTLLMTAPARAKQIHSIPYGVDENADLFQREIQGPLRIIYCARLDSSQKRCRDLVPIWKSFAAGGGVGALIILGVGRDSAFLNSELSDEIRKGHVQLRGQVSSGAVLQEMANSDILLNISNYEGLPQVVLEGASLGLHPLLSDIESGHREIVARLGAGTLCHVGDTAGFASALLQLQENLDEIRKQRGNVREKALAHYSLTESSRRYRELIEQVSLEALPVFQATYQSKSLGDRLKRLQLLIKYRRHFRS